MFENILKYCIFSRKCSKRDDSLTLKCWTYHGTTLWKKTQNNWLPWILWGESMIKIAKKVAPLHKN